MEVHRRQQPQPVKIHRSSEGEEEQEKAIKLLEERLVVHDNNRKAVQDKLHETCEGLRAQIDELEDRVNKELEEKFTSEDNRLQAALNELRGNRTTSALQKAKAELLVEQSYELVENNKKKKEEEKDDKEEDRSEEEDEESDTSDDDESDISDDDEDDKMRPVLFPHHFLLRSKFSGRERNRPHSIEDANDDNENGTVKPKLDLTTLYELETKKRVVPELIETRKPTNVLIAGVDRGRVSVEFTYLNFDEKRVLSDHNFVNPVKYKCTIFKKSNEQEGKEEHPLDKNEGNGSSFFTFTPDFLESETPYGIRAKMMIGDRESEWSDDVAEFITPEFKECCVWKECPAGVYKHSKYSVDRRNPRVATNINKYGYECTIIGNTSILLDKVTSWSVKILKSEKNDGDDIYIGVAPFDIDQSNYNNHNKCGWYFACSNSTLVSGPPHEYTGETYGPRKKGEQYVHTGDSVGVVMDTARGELSIVLNGVNLGVAYDGIPLDKPLVPCVLLGNKGGSVELDLSEVKGGVDSSITVPSNITIKIITWDSIALTWDEVSGASSYQIEVDESKAWDASTTNAFTERGLLPETEHSFRVRTIKGDLVSKWSGVVKGKTLKAPGFKECAWKESPGYVDKGNKYHVDEKNPRIATNVDYSSCTIIGNICIPLNTVTSWNIKILKSMNNNGGGIGIGVAPFDIDQNKGIHNHHDGWYYDCGDSELSSGPPHNYIRKEYGPRKKERKHVHTGDSVGVVMDTTKGDLSFVLNGVNLGAAYEGIPLDKPLVPCVLIFFGGDSVELVA